MTTAHPIVNPFDRESSPRRVDDRLMDARELVAQFENDVLYGPEQLPDAIQRRVKEIQGLFPDLPQETAPLNYYLATTWHDLSNRYRRAFLKEVRDAVRTRKTSMASMTQSEMDRLSDQYDDRSILEQVENEAVQTYEMATKGYWKSIRQDEQDAEVLENDLAYRVATMRERGELRERTQKQLLQQLEAYIDRLPTSGKQSELKIMYLIRRLALDKGLSHLIQIEHGLPREDMAEKKIDLRLTIGSRMIPLQMKTENTADEYRAEHNERVRAKVREVLEHQDTRLVVLDTDQIQDSYRHWKDTSATKGKKITYTRARNQLLEAIRTSLPEDITEIQEVFALLQGTEQKEATPTGKRMTADFLQRNLGIPVLVEFGLIPAGCMDMTLIRGAREKMTSNLAVLSRLFGSQEGFQQRTPEQVQQVRQAFGI